MKKLKWYSTGLLVILTAMLVLEGCGVAQADYDALQAQNTALETEKNTLQSQAAALQAEKQTLQSDFDSLTGRHTGLQAENDQLESDLEDLRDRYDAVNAELADIMTLYPPRNFESITELEIWLTLNDVSGQPAAATAEEWIGKALEIQADALVGGYVINVDYDYDIDTDTFAVFCTTLIDGLIYFWDPETDNIMRDATLTVISSTSVIYLQR